MNAYTTDWFGENLIDSILESAAAKTQLCQYMLCPFQQINQFHIYIERERHNENTKKIEAQRIRALRKKFYLNLRNRFELHSFNSK